MKDLIIISGPTGVGKTELVEGLAVEAGFEIISADSQAVYRGLDIGTAKPETGRGAKYHLVDVADPAVNYNVSRFVSDAGRAYEEIRDRGVNVLMAGGSTMYIHRFLYGLADVPGGSEGIRERLRREELEEGEGTLYARLCTIDPKYARRIHENDRKRIIRALEVYEISGRTFSSYEETEKKPRYNALFYILDRKRSNLYERINRRVDQMISAGWVEEIKGLMERGVSPESPGFASLGYREIAASLRDGTEMSETVERIKTETRHFARRQLIWLRKEKNAHWMDADALDIDGMKRIIMDDWKTQGG